MKYEQPEPQFRDKAFVAQIISAHNGANEAPEAKHTSEALPITVSNFF